VKTSATRHAKILEGQTETQLFILVRGGKVHHFFLDFKQKVDGMVTKLDAGPWFSPKGDPQDCANTGVGTLVRATALHEEPTKQHPRVVVRRQVWFFCCALSCAAQKVTMPWNIKQEPNWLRQPQKI
jgi:hypothetical protein